MTKKALAAALLLSLLAAAASAQEATPETQAVETEDEAEAQPEPRRPLRVLENPYDISSFYRSSDGLVYGPEGGASERYPIAGYYRQRGGPGYGYAQFWTSGYSDRGRGSHARLGIGFRRSIGENGDLFLFAPAILAPVGPLTGVFFGGFPLR